MFLGRAAHHTVVPAVTGHFSQKANGLGSCILTRKVVSFYGPELVAVVWGGKAVGKLPVPHPRALFFIPGPAVLPRVILMIPF